MAAAGDGGLGYTSLKEDVIGVIARATAKSRLLLASVDIHTLCRLSLQLRSAWHVAAIVVRKAHVAIGLLVVVELV